MFAMPICIVVYLTRAALANEKADNNTLTIGLSIPWEQGWKLGGLIGSAFVLGIREVEKRQLLPGYEIKWIWRDSYCEPRRGMAMAVDMWTSADLAGIIGDVCSDVCLPQALLAAAWNIPIVTVACANPVLSDKSNYPTFTRIGQTFADMDKTYNAVADMMGWNRICILTTVYEVWALTAEAARLTLERSGKDVLFHVIQTTVRGDQIDHDSIDALRDLLKTLKTKVRLFFIFTYQADLENLLMAAIDVDMFNGQFIFVCAYQWHVDFSLRYPYKTEKERLAFEGLMGLSVKTQSGEQYDRFRQDVIQEFQTGIFENMPHVEASTQVSDINAYAGNVFKQTGVTFFIHGYCYFWKYFTIEVSVHIHFIDSRIYAGK